MKIICLLIVCFIILPVKLKAQSNVVPIIELNSGSLLGGAENGKLIDAKTTIRSLPANSTYKLFPLNSGDTQRIVFRKPKDAGAPCEGFYSIGDRKDAGFGIAIGENAGWNPVPRIPQKIDLNSAAYKKVVSDVLRLKGITDAKINLTKAFRVDLEGDGREEVLIEASSYADYPKSSAKRGDYSLILLRKIVGGKVQNIIVSGDFITKTIKFGAPGKYELSSIADLDGDGKMEIVIYASYYEGMWVETHEIIGGKTHRIKILATNCGV